MVLVSLCWLVAHGQTAEGISATVQTNAQGTADVQGVVDIPASTSSVEIAAAPELNAMPVDQGHVPRLFPLTSPRLPFDDGQTGPVTGESVDTTNAAPAKGVFLTRHLYGSAGAAKRAAAKRAATAAATASTITESGQAVPGADATGAITTMATCGTGTCNYTAGNITSCFLPPTGGCGSNIIYHDPQPVMRTLKLVPMFYGSWTTAQKTIVTDFLTGLPGSRWMGINALYSDRTGPISNAAPMYSTSYTFTSTSTYGKSLTDSSVVNLIKAGIKALTGSSTGGAGAGNAITKCRSACIPSQITATTTPSGDLGIDGMLSVVAHEITEAASDPLVNAWFDAGGNENADICAWQFGTQLTSSTGKVYNMQGSNGKYYFLQMNLNPNTGNCVNGV